MYVNIIFTVPWYKAEKKKERESGKKGMKANQILKEHVHFLYWLNHRIVCVVGYFSRKRG
jgi:hypothetical protein